MVKKDNLVVPDEVVMNKIYVIRNQKAMLDRDLAELYQVETKVLKQSVKRNMDIFPEHFMFELTEKEFEVLRSQFVTSKEGRGGTRYLPMVFSEHGVLQLANVIRSGVAKQMSIRIIEVFVKMRQMLTDNTELRLDIETIKKKLDNQDKNMEIVFRYLDELIKRKRIQRHGQRSVTKCLSINTTVFISNKCSILILQFPSNEKDNQFPAFSICLCQCLFTKCYGSVKP